VSALMRVYEALPSTSSSTVNSNDAVDKYARPRCGYLTNSQREIQPKISTTRSILSPDGIGCPALETEVIVKGQNIIANRME